MSSTNPKLYHPKLHWDHLRLRVTDISQHGLSAGSMHQLQERVSTLLKSNQTMKTVHYLDSCVSLTGHLNTIYNTVS